MPTTKLSSLIAPSFYSVHNDIKKNRYTHYWLKGGRGSTKSTFVGIEIPLGIMKNPGTNGVALRKVGTYLTDSVYSQLVWAIDALGVSEYWQYKKSPLELIYIPTGQKIIFRGADEPRKIKSTKLAQGYFRYIWYEETDEFNGMEDIRTINQSLMRGGEKFDVFYTYNPPKSVNSWVNAEASIDMPNRLVHHSDYTTVPVDWLGRQFIIEAEHLKKTKPEAYRHEYMGEVTGTGGEVFDNVTLRIITDAEIKEFDHIRRGIDWGYAVDPFAYIVGHYDKTRRRLYLFYEIYQVKLSNVKAAEFIKAENKSYQFITADSAEPKSIDEVRGYGLRISKARKGADSVDFGMKFLQDLEEIVIDPQRCPNAAREFTMYELERDNNGNFTSSYPDANNHAIDAVRYMLESDARNRIAPVTIQGV